MLTNWIHRHDPDDEGFTLIELLIVIIIIGILAAIAVPVFLNQRKKGYDTAAKSDLRNLANFEEIYLNDYGTYAGVKEVAASEPVVASSHDVKLRVEGYDGSNGYCLSSVSQNSGHKFFYDSEAGGLQPTPSCPVVNSHLTGGTYTVPAANDYLIGGVGG
ncbi:MAG TPA: prepilin-type N-terminal cleavage/methylation domain-containing protein [Mycobacteriales bacterium]|nr:prepilin-type N-terminal cleavage/methylation domain-containing protein [Mycobacteriales bacterium]